MVATLSAPFPWLSLTGLASREPDTADKHPKNILLFLDVWGKKLLMEKYVNKDIKVVDVTLYKL